MVDTPDPQPTAPPVVTTNVPWHFLSGEDSRLVIARPDTARPPVRLGGAVSIRHPLEPPPLHDALEASMLSPSEHIDPLTDCEVRRRQGSPRLYHGVLYKYSYKFPFQT